MANLGKSLAASKRGAVEVEVFENGIAIRQGQRRMESTWVGLLRLHYQQTQIFLNGVPQPRSYVMQFFLPDGKVFTLATRSEDEATVMALALQVSAPALAARDLATFDAGGQVDLGAVTIDQHHIRVKKGARTRRLPLSELAGWVLRKGYLLLDRKRAKPRLWVELPVGQVGNLFSLEAILARVYPEGDLAREEYAQQARRRAPKAPWTRPTAAVRNPGGLTRRGWFMVLMFLPTLFALYALVALPFAIAKESYAAEVDARFDEVAAVGRRVAAGLPAADPPGAQDLAQACEGRLDYGPADSIAGFFGPMPEPLLSRQGKYDRSKPHLRMVAANSAGALLGQAVEREIYDYHNLWTAWADILTEAPMDWDRRVHDYTYYHRDLANARYLAVAAVRQLKKPRYPDAGSAQLFVRVVALPSGESRCEGVIRARLDGRDGYQATAVDRALLLPVCQVGGDELCEATTRRD